MRDVLIVVVAAGCGCCCRIDAATNTARLGRKKSQTCFNGTMGHNGQVPRVGPTAVALVIPTRVTIKTTGKAIPPRTYGQHITR